MMFLYFDLDLYQYLHLVKNRLAPMQHIDFQAVVGGYRKSSWQRILPLGEM